MTEAKLRALVITLVVSALPKVGAAMTETSSGAFAPPAPPPPAPLVAPASSATPDIAFRLQGGLTTGVLEGQGAGFALTGAARWSSLSVEVGGRYRTPRDVAFPGGEGFARVSLFEIMGRGCWSLDLGRMALPLCLGASGGRLSVDPAEGTPANPSAGLWVGAHALVAARYRFTPQLSLWLGAEGTASALRPQASLDPERAPAGDPWRPGRFGLAVELGVELTVN